MIVNRKKYAGCALLFFSFSAVSFGAEAKSPSWDYVGAAVIVGGEVTSGSFEADMRGYQLEAVKSLGEMVFFRLLVNANQADAGFGGLDMDLGTQQLGFGMRFPVSSTMDLWAALNYERYTLEGVVGTGPGVDVGVRAMVTDNVELGALAKVYGDVDFGGGLDGDYIGYELSAALYLSKATALQLSFGTHEMDVDGTELKYENVLRLGFRLGF